MTWDGDQLLLSRANLRSYLLVPQCNNHQDKADHIKMSHIPHLSTNLFAATVVCMTQMHSRQAWSLMDLPTRHLLSTQLIFFSVPAFGRRVFDANHLE